MRVHNRLASSKSRVTNERNFSATPISSSLSFFLYLVFSSSSFLFLSVIAATARHEYPTDRNEIERLRGQSRRFHLRLYLRTPTYVVPRTVQRTHSTHAHIRSRARGASTCGSKTATLLVVYLLVFSIIFTDLCLIDIELDI